MPKLSLWSLALAVGLFGSTANAEDFHGYPCTVDCSGHEAGYDWAAQNGVDDPDSCGGNSNSFIEGCRARAEEHEAKEDLWGNPSDIPDDENDNSYLGSDDEDGDWDE